MPITPLKAFLSVAAVAVVGVTSAYVAGVFDRFIEAPSQTIAALPDKPTPDGPADATPKPDGSVGAAATSPAPAEGGDAAAPAVIAPSFDLVRGQTSAGPEGDFAIVLDDTLEPGGYQIVLRSTTGEGVVAMSPETAVVSIPDLPSGQVLALVEKPGEPSKLITVPEPGRPAGDAQANAQQEGGQTGAQTSQTEPQAGAAPQAGTEQPAAAAEAAPAEPKAE